MHNHFISSGWRNDILIKLVYFPEVYAAREKVGVYIPKDRYQQEENERKVVFDLS
jgi:hypothetical protein